MDMGATVCTRSKPACERCPVQADCQGLSQGNPTAYPHSKPKKSIPARNGIMPVSYTHLDVYKRQWLHFAGLMRNLVGVKCNSSPD